MPTYYPSHNYGPEHAASLALTSPKPAKQPRKTSRRRISERQLAANRENAKKSTGPRTESGKATCSMNALRHGFTGQISALTEEDRNAQHTFCNPIVEDLKPEGAIERQLAHSIAEGHWRLNRIRAMEDNIFALGHYGPAAEIEADHPELHAALTSARVFLESAKELERLTLYEQRIARGVEKNMAQLAALQAQRNAERERALDEAASLAQLAHFNGEKEGESEKAATCSSRNGSVFSAGEIRDRMRRKQALKAAAFHERHHWNPEISYPKAPEKSKGL